MPNYPKKPHVNFERKLIATAVEKRYPWSMAMVQEKISCVERERTGESIEQVRIYTVYLVFQSRSYAHTLGKEMV